MTSFNHDFKSQPGQMQQATGNNRSEAFSNRPGKPVNQIRLVTSRSRVKSGAAPSARHIEMPHRIQSPGPGGPSRPARPYIMPTPCSSDSDPSIPPSRHSPSALRSRKEHHLPWFQKKKKKTPLASTSPAPATPRGEPESLLRSCHSRRLGRGEVSTAPWEHKSLARDDVVGAGAGDVRRGPAPRAAAAGGGGAGAALLRALQVLRHHPRGTYRIHV